MAEIILFDGTIALVDDEDFELVNSYRWSVTKPGHRRTVYARTNVKKEEGGYRTERMHRLVLGLKFNDGLVVDHINGDGLDNRKSNLRVCTISQNAANVKLSRGNSSGYKGVSHTKSNNTWVAEVRKNNRNVYRYYSKCKHLAATKYNEAAKEIHGEFCWLNDIKKCSCAECVEYRREIASQSLQ